MSNYMVNPNEVEITMSHKNLVSSTQKACGEIIGQIVYSSKWVQCSENYISHILINSMKYEPILFLSKCISYF